MNKELTKEEAEEYYNKLWLENKELIQDNMNKLSMERFELELELVDKDKEIERLHSIINEFMEELKWQRKVSLSLNEAFTVSRIDTLINKLQELKGSGSNENG